MGPAQLLYGHTFPSFTIKLSCNIVVDRRRDVRALTLVYKSGHKAAEPSLQSESRIKNDTSRTCSLFRLQKRPFKSSTTHFCSFDMKYCANRFDYTRKGRRQISLKNAFQQKQSSLVKRDQQFTIWFITTLLLRDTKKARLH